MRALFLLFFVFYFTLWGETAYGRQMHVQQVPREKLDWQVKRPPNRSPTSNSKNSKPRSKLNDDSIASNQSLPPPITKPLQPLAQPLAQPVSKPKVAKEVVKEPSIVKKKEIIVLDAGHGGKDTGALSKKNAYVEKNLTLQTVNMLKSCLNQMGYEVRLTRHEDKFVSLDERAVFANKHKAALFVSIHYNYCAAAEVEGIEVFYHRDEKTPYAKRIIESRKLGEIVLSKIVKNTGAVSRGVKKANFAVIRETTMPAILIEGGFLSNPAERQKILDAPYLRFFAQGVANGIDSYLKSCTKT